MKKVIAVILSMVLCLSAVPSAVFAEGEGEGGGDPAGITVTAVSPAFQLHTFSELYTDGKLLPSPEMESVTIEDDISKGGLFIEGTAEALNAGRLTIADEYDFDEKPEGRRTDVGPVGRITIDGLSAKKATVKVNVYLDEEAEPCMSMLLRREMGKTSWAREGELTQDVLDKKITGKHRVSIGFDVTTTAKKAKILLRSLTFCENSVPVMYFDLDETEGSIDAMNGSDNHSVECYGSATLQVPDGYKGEFSDEVLKTMKNMELEYIRGRGNSTWYMDKKPYKVKFDKKQDLLGMGANKHWVLLANRYDDSLLRNRVTYWIVRYLGVEYAIKCAPVELVMNGRYFGSYLLSEQVRIDENRIDIDELDEKVSDPESIEITGGYLLNLGGYDDEDESGFATRHGGCFAIESPDFEDYKAGEASDKAKKAQRDYIAGYTQEVEDAIFGEDFTDEQGRHYSSLLDEDSAVDYWWIQEFSINGDAFGGGSNYMYKKRNTLEGDNVQIGKLYWGPLWDFDYVAWGNPNSDPDNYEGFNNTSHDWMSRLRADEEFCTRLRSRWHEAPDSADNIYRAHLSDAVEEVVKEGGVIDDYYDEVRISEYYDYVRWGFSGEGGSDYSDYRGTGVTPGKEGEQQPEQNEQPETEKTYESTVEQLRNWIKLRGTWVADNIDKIGVNKYTVRFLIDGEAIETRTYIENEEIGKMPDAPDRDGYTFMGWYDGDYKFEEEDTAYADLDLTAKYEKTSKLKKAENIYFDKYDVYQWFYNYSGDDDDDYYPSYKLMPEGSVTDNITWTVDDPEVASVNEYGTVSPKKAGTVTVTATLSTGKKNSFRVTFVDEAEEIYEVETISLNKSKLSMKTGSYTQLIYDCDPKPHYTAYVDWFVMDPEIASVDEYGIITAKKPGTTMIIALEADSRRYAVCRVTVSASDAYRIKAAKAAKVKSVKAKVVRSGKKRNVKVTWKKAKDVSGYYVLRASSKNGKYKKAGTVKKAKTVKWTDKKVTRGKTYYYKVQPFTKINGKKYTGKKSMAAKVKVK